MSGYVLLRHRDIPDIQDLKVYQDNGGFKSLKKALTKLKPDEVTNIVKASGLRGRGGAGFPTGLKWGKVVNHRMPERYFVCNAGDRAVLLKESRNV